MRTSSCSGHALPRRSWVLAGPLRGLLCGGSAQARYSRRLKDPPFLPAPPHCLEIRLPQPAPPSVSEIRLPQPAPARTPESRLPQLAPPRQRSAYLSWPRPSPPNSASSAGPLLFTEQGPHSGDGCVSSVRSTRALQACSLASHDPAHSCSPSFRAVAQPVICSEF